MTEVVIFIVGAWCGLVAAALINMAKEEKKNGRK